ncbi:MAG: helix-turn-helix transcriptional regulator [Solirubrobacteraceae bacterium]
MSTTIVSPVLVGRRTELQVLEAALGRAVIGQATAVLLSGEAGVGKSRLVLELTERARASGARVLVGGCAEFGGEGIPFGPVVEVMRTLADEVEPDELDGFLGPARNEFVRLLPELGDGGALPALDEGVEASRLHELILGLVSRLAAAQPLVLVFEDVQWADRSTLELTALLVRGLVNRRVLLICTVRFDELHRAHPFRRIAGRWEQQRAVERVDLDRLSVEEVRAQIEAIVDERPDGRLVDLVFERSEGIPLFVEELIGAVRDRGAERDYLPPSLRDILLARVDLLSDDARNVLRVASAAGSWVPDDLLALVAALPEDRLYAAVREIVEHQLLVVDPTGRGYAFRHALARDAVHDDLLPGERARLHRAYAEALERDSGIAGPEVTRAAMLAHHWAAAHDLPRALAASVRAGFAAAHAAGPAEAQRHLELALELWSEVPDAAEHAGVAHADVLEAAALAAHHAGAVERGLALSDEALAELGPGGPPERRAVLLARRARMVGDLARGDDGISDLEKALALLSDEAPTRVTAQVLAALARTRLLAYDLTGARAAAEQAVQTADAVGALEESCDAAISLGSVVSISGDAESGLALLRDAGKRAREAGLAWTALRAAINLTDRLAFGGRHEEAIAVAQEGREYAEQSGLARTAGAYLRANQVESLIRVGRWREAALNAAPGTEAPGLFAGGFALIRGELHALRGHRREGESELAEARQQLPGERSRQFVFPLAWLEAELARLGGELDRAGEILEPLIEAIDPREVDRYVWAILWLAMRIEVERSRGGAEMTDRVSALVDRMAVRTLPDAGHEALVIAELARATRTGEVGAWGGAVDACRSMNEAFPLAYALLRRAEALAAAGERAAANDALRESIELAEQMGAEPLVAEIRAFERAARLQPDAAGADDADSSPGGAPDDEIAEFGLTAREREVLMLIADGRSNGQIADELVISRTTASVHVSNILSKLDVSTRVEAAALAHRRGLTSTPADA